MAGRKNNDASEQAEQIAEDAAKSMNELGRQARSRADDAKKEAVKGLNTAAATLRREAREAGASREIRDSVDGVARGLEKTATYLNKNSFEDMGEDVTRAVKRNPGRSLAIVFLVGLVIGLLLRGGNQNR
jgi:hypothetical protein